LALSLIPGKTAVALVRQFETEATAKMSGLPDEFPDKFAAKGESGKGGRPLPLIQLPIHTQTQQRGKLLNCLPKSILAKPARKSPVVIFARNHLNRVHVQNCRFSEEKPPVFKLDAV